jgi:hypothetical protein
MTMPQNVIYLPPGVMPPAPNGAAAQAANIPFNRQFFEAMLPQAIKSYCEQVHCTSPQVQVATLDGSLHHVVGISGVTDGWVAVHATREDHDHSMEVFLPYQTIYRVEIHPEADAAHNHLGFSLPLDGSPTPAVQLEAPAKAKAKPKAKPRKTPKKAAATAD